MQRKIKSVALGAVITASALVLIAGCANEERSTPTAVNAESSKRTYSREYLDQTGQHQIGPALEAADPSIQSTGGR
ncbi:MAG: hypothetical protein ACR2G0_03755 [Chthoniobacterales bacterium]